MIAAHPNDVKTCPSGSQANVNPATSSGPAGHQPALDAALDAAAARIATAWYTALRRGQQPAGLHPAATADHVADLARSAVAALAATGLLQLDLPGPPPAAAHLRMAAAGRREYAANLTGARGPLGAAHTALLAQAATLEQAARVVDGDIRPLCGWLPTWRWTPEMLAAVGAQAPAPVAPAAPATADAPVDPGP